MYQKIYLDDFESQHKNKQALVFLHGWGFHSGVFQKLISAFSLPEHFSITLIDLPGFKERPTLNFPKDYLLEMIKIILQRTPKKSVWIGWSLGGLIAMQAAYLFPERVMGCVTVASSPKFLQAENWPGLSPEIFNKFCTRLQENVKTTLTAFLHLQKSLQWGTKNDKITLRFLKDCLLSRSLPSPFSLKIGLDILQTTDLRHEISGIRCPMLCFFGEQDALIPVAVRNEITQLAPHIETRCIPKQGHGGFLTEPSFVLKEIEHFLNVHHF